MKIGDEVWVAGRLDHFEGTVPKIAVCETTDILPVAVVEGMEKAIRFAVETEEQGYVTFCGPDECDPFEWLRSALAAYREATKQP